MQPPGRQQATPLKAERKRSRWNGERGPFGMEKDERTAGREGERKNGGKRRRILSRFQIKDQTNRSTPSAGCVSFFSIPFCPRAYPPFFSPSPSPPFHSPSPQSDPSGRPPPWVPLFFSRILAGVRGKSNPKVTGFDGPRFKTPALLSLRGAGKRDEGLANGPILQMIRQDSSG